MVKPVTFVEPIGRIDGSGSGRNFVAGVGWCVLGRRIIYPTGRTMATPLRLNGNLPNN
jgi:hypothetical protein